MEWRRWSVFTMFQCQERPGNCLGHPVCRGRSRGCAIPNEGLLGAVATRFEHPVREYSVHLHLHALLRSTLAVQIERS
jgi:hypothetical protein